MANESKEAAAKSGAAKKPSSLIRLDKSIVKPTSKEGRMYANIGLNDEHGKYGTLFFSEASLKQDKNAPNKAYLPLSPNKEYDVAFGRGEERQIIKMSGADIVSKNHAFMKEMNAQRTNALEAQADLAPEQQNEVSK